MEGFTMLGAFTGGSDIFFNEIPVGKFVLLLDYSGAEAFPSQTWQSWQLAAWPVLWHMNFCSTRRQLVQTGFCKIFRKTCLCASPSPGPTGEGQFTAACHPWTLRGAALCRAVVQRVSLWVKQHPGWQRVASSRTGAQVALSCPRLCRWSGQGPASASSPWKFWGNVAFAEIPYPVTCACLWKQRCGFKPFSSSGYLVLCSPNSESCQALCTHYLCSELCISASGASH